MQRKMHSEGGCDLILATDIPDSEGDVLVLHSLHVEPWKKAAWTLRTPKKGTNSIDLGTGLRGVGWRQLRGAGLTDGWDSGDDLAELELVEDGGFTGGIETNHEDAAVLFADEFSKHLAEDSHALP